MVKIIGQSESKVEMS